MRSILSWLDSLGLGQYAEVFRANDVGMEVIPSLSEQDMEKLGVSLGHRKKLLKAITEIANSNMPLNVSATLADRVPGSMSEGERRQLTVMFCDMVGFTELASRVDPEVLQRIIRAYEDACAVCITRYEGYVYQRLGDGIVSFFGFPLAHEGEAERAIHAGVEIIDSLSKLTVPEVGRVSVRIGIATGLVVVSSIEKGAVGETMNLASRLQGISPVGGVVVSERTRRLAGGAFRYLDLGPQTLKGLPSPTAAFAVLGVSEATSRFEAATQEGLTTLVGREQELGLLLDSWALAQEGEGQVVLLSGEPGIGKSRVLRALRERLEAMGSHTLAFQCSPYHTNSAFYPSIDNLERALQFTRDESPEVRLDKLEALMEGMYQRPRADVRYIGAMLSLPVEARYGSVNMTPQRFKDETLRALVDLIETTTNQHKTVVLFEDAHWADPTSLELLDHLIERINGIPLLVVITHRPEFQKSWDNQGQVTRLTLSRLTKSQSTGVINRIVQGKVLPGNLLDQILAKTDGVPLFVEELTKSLLESGSLIEKEDRFEYAGDVRSLTIPETLRDSLMARLDRHSTAKEIAQIGSVIGREFNYELLKLVTRRSDTALGQSLEQLTASGLAFRRGTPPEATYTFKHALVQDAAYDSLLMTRRRELHAMVARTLVENFPEEVSARPTFIAHQLTEAGQSEQAIRHWTRAGQLALASSANVEAITYFTRALGMMQPMVRSLDVLRTELDINLGLWPAYMATRGFSSAEMGNAALRARELSEQLGDEKETAIARVAKFAFHFVRAELSMARAEIEPGLEIAQRIGDQALTAQMNFLTGDLCFWEGKLADAKHYLAQAVIHGDAARAKTLTERTGLDAHCLGLAYTGLNEFALGYADRSLEIVNESMRYAEELGNAQTSGHCLGVVSWLALYRNDVKAARELASRTIEYCREQRLMFWEASTYLVEGWVWIQEGAIDKGLSRMYQGLEFRQMVGAGLVHSSFYAILAEVHRHQNEFDIGLDLVTKGLAHVKKSGEGFYESELFRMQGEIILSQFGDVITATESFRQAIAIARRQQARVFELRAACSLAKLKELQGEREMALALVAPIYDSFTEGFNTKDLKDAEAVLEALRH